ncbi:MAG: Clp protease N-terminal domain-containing protein [Chloroflexota bacterium]
MRPPPKMERFVNASRLILSTAQAEAEPHQHTQITVLHILVAMTIADKTDAYFTLSDFDIVTAKVRPYMLAKCKHLINESDDYRFDLSANTKKMLELAVDEARRRGHQVIAPGHMLLGIIRIEDAIAQDFLAHFDLQAKDLRKRIEYYFDQHDPNYFAPQPERVEENENSGCLAAVRRLFGRL